ncbi:hypothetical protein ACWGJ9_11265 [Curtobacterium citreum]
MFASKDPVLEFSTDVTPWRCTHCKNRYRQDHRYKNTPHETVFDPRPQFAPPTSHSHNPLLARFRRELEAAGYDRRHPEWGEMKVAEIPRFIKKFLRDVASEGEGTEAAHIEHATRCLNRLYTASHVLLDPTGESLLALAELKGLRKLEKRATKRAQKAARALLRAEVLAVYPSATSIRFSVSSDEYDEYEEDDLEVRGIQVSEYREVKPSGRLEDEIIRLYRLTGTRESVGSSYYRSYYRFTLS